jgi:site-specific DNA-methyltransferase (adenine-specific)/modification methylase
LEHIIKVASNENDTVFDPFMGVASTGVAALKNNRKFIGIELLEEYYIASENRLKKIK